MPLFKKFFADRTGATAIEYGLIAALIAVALIYAWPAAHTKTGAPAPVAQASSSGK